MRLVITTLMLVACPSILLAAQEAVTVVGRAPYSYPDVPRPFRFLFPGDPPAAGGPGDLWAGLPFDSISLQRTSCLGTCSAYTVTFYRRTARSGIRDSNGDQFGRALLTVTRAARGQRGTRGYLEARGTFEGGVDIFTFASLSYLIQKWALPLKDEPPPMMVTDAPAAFVNVSAPGVSGTVNDDGGMRTIELWAVQVAMDSAAQSIAWTRK